MVALPQEPVSPLAHEPMKVESGRAVEIDEGCTFRLAKIEICSGTIAAKLSFDETEFSGPPGLNVGVPPGLAASDAAPPGVLAEGPPGVLLSDAQGPPGVLCGPPGVLEADACAGPPGVLTAPPGSFVADPEQDLFASGLWDASPVYAAGAPLERAIGHGRALACCRPTRFLLLLGQPIYSPQ